jgi:metal-responsive CopG/Arc/MetJ family transcriptional regulator
LKTYAVVSTNGGESMGSDDASKDSIDLETYLSTWGDLGFDAPSFQEGAVQLKPSEFADLQRTVESAQHLKARMKPFASSEDIHHLIDEFRNPNDWEGVEDQFNQWTTTNAPWESGFYRWYPQWSLSEEMVEQFWNIISIAALLDESSWTSLDLLLPLVAQPANYPNIINELEQLVQDEERQRTLIEKAVLQLNQKGYNVAIQSSKIIEQFDEIEDLQRYSNRMDLLRLQIQSDILPFDPVLAETFGGRANDLVASPSNEIETLEKNVATISAHLQNRLSEMNTMLRQWQSEGYTYEERLRILPEDLLEWEHLLPEIEQQYHRHSGALERWNEIKKLWNQQDATIDRIVGKIEHTDVFLDKIDALEQQWTEKELQGASLIERWEQFGFDMDVWRYKMTHDPRQGLEELNLQLPLYNRANVLLEGMLQLDTSLGGEEETERRSTILRTMDLDDDLLDEMEQWLSKKTLRNTRHRRMLQAEWERAGREGKVNSEKTFSDLYSFEHAVASIEHQSQHLIASGVTSHAIERTKAELMRLEGRGWNITELLQLLNEQPDAFFQQFPKAMEAMSRIVATQRRIATLDWRRDVHRAGEISRHVRNPLQLVKIEQQIPALIRHLADREIEDEAYTYTSWLPEQRPVLLPREQSLIRKVPAKAQPQSTLEEAHEAMLEAMDSEPVTGIEDAETRPGNEERPSVSTQTTSLPVVVDTRPVAEEEELVIEEKKTVVAPVSTSVVEGDLTAYERLLRLIGLTEEADILAGSRDVSVVRRAVASHVGSEPRDVRVDRLLRLMLRLLPQGDQGDGERSEMIDSIVEVLPKYNQWVRMRLEARHMGASGTFFEDATRLGTALHRVPGPGVRVPLHADTYPLPEPSNLNELRQQTDRLIQSMHLPAAGGIN